MKVGDFVRCRIGHTGANLVPNQLYQVAVIVLKGHDHLGEIKTAGIILTTGYPYVWDIGRFVVQR